MDSWEGRMWRPVVSPAGRKSDREDDGIGRKRNKAQSELDIAPSLVYRADLNKYPPPPSRMVPRGEAFGEQSHLLRAGGEIRNPTEPGDSAKRVTSSGNCVSTRNHRQNLNKYAPLADGFAGGRGGPHVATFHTSCEQEVGYRS